MRKATLACIACVLAAGCQSTQLRKETNTQARTVTDLYYEEVLDNIALLNNNPAALPYFSVAGTGTNQIQRAIQGNEQIGIDLVSNIAKTAFVWLWDKEQLSLQATLTRSDQWQSATTPDPDELLLMQCAYHEVLGASTPECKLALEAFFSDSPYITFVRPGWFTIGAKKEVPKCASYVGHCGKTYVWVTSDGLDGLSNFTLAILDIATAAYQQQVPDHLANVLKSLNQRRTDINDILKNNKPQLSSDQERDLNEELKKIVEALVKYEKLAQMPNEDLRLRVQNAFRATGPKSADERLELAELYRRLQESGPRLGRPRKNFYNPYAPTIAAP